MGIQIAAFNHLLNQHPAVRAELAAHAGRRVAVALPPFHVAGVFTDDGWLAACEGEPEATVRLKHAVALAAAAGRDPALSDIQLEGDAELAAALGRLLGRLQWNAAEDLSRLVGDAAAQRAETLARGLLGFKGQVAWRLAANWVEHLREETPVLAGRRQVQGFVAAVDTLRDDAGRLEKRLARLQAALQQEQTKA
ncbi:sterol-binding protein [Chromobacterium sp. S0633]|uniref:ubiquinone biosynthesis accessory factor UbiJ n=1 Tax=unclassified Chromobacterium TaxID=2641838 RepID=UPI000D30A051|nr:MULTISPECIES: sterol-binding protein [unclassified Chromobacterium]MCP1289244.1 sterol-binding protein [Chromobacterium sp. S0633]PTU63824.1 sterol-binding protein [Chromobacterium sp. Panama]